MNRFNNSRSTIDPDDISEADPLDIAKILRDTDDMDGDLFKGMNTKFSGNKTMPTPSSKPVTAIQKNKSFTFDDDPTEDLDALIGKSNLKKQNESVVQKKPPISSSPASGVNKNVKNSISFDDFDDSFLMETRPRTGSKPQQNNHQEPMSPQTTSHSPKPKSLVEDLFGSKSSKENNPPLSDTTAKSNNFEFKLSEKYTNMSAKGNDDDFAFGGYVPSAIASSVGPRSTSNNGSRRNVAFTDDLFESVDLFATTPNRPKTSPASQSNTNANANTNPLMKSLPIPSKSSTDDWLDPTPKFTSTVKPQQSNDWFAGSSNIGSDISSTRHQKQTTSNTFNLDTDKIVVEKPPIASVNSVTKTAVPAQNKAESMNSSFADSIEVEKPNALGSVTNAILGSINNIQPLQFEMKTTTQNDNFTHGSSHAPSDHEDGWLNNLITNKKTNKKVTNQNNQESNTNNALLNDKSYFGYDRSSTPGSVHDQNTSIAKLLTTKTNTNTNPEQKFKPITLISNVNYDSNEIQAMLQKIKQLEYENQDLHMQLQHNKAHYELQIQLIQDSCENRIRMIQEDRDNVARHFKEEKEILQNHINIIEKEKHEMSNSYKRKTEDLKNECDSEIEKLRRIQREAIENLKLEHESVLSRVKRMKDTEVDAAMAATTHTRTIESVLNLIEDNAKNLDGLSQKVQMGHMMNINEHEIQLRNKEEQLKIKEERLEKQQKEYESEIRMLNETIHRLENHLAEQSKNVAEERWKGKQHEKKLEALQEALMSDQRIVMDKLVRERNDIDRSKNEILAEQKRLMQAIYEEKRKIAEDRAKLDAEISGYKDKQHKDSLSNINIEAELSVGTRRLNEEKIKLEQSSKELKEREIALKEERVIVEEKKRELDAKTAKLEQMAFAVNQKYSHAEDLLAKSSREKENQSRILEQANSVKSNHESRLNQIQQQLVLLNEREGQLNQEKLNIYKQRQELELFKSNIVCNKCKEPVKDFGLIGTTMPSSGYGSMIHGGSGIGSLLNQSSNLRYQALSNFQMSSSDLEDARNLRQSKIQALKDRQFLNEEKQFIDTLGNGINSRSYSLNQLNSSAVFG